MDTTDPDTDDTDGIGDSELDEWAAELSDRVGDGGGCLETAAATSDSRSRRAVLAGAFAGVMSVGAFPAVTAANETDDEESDSDTTANEDPDAVTVESPPQAEQARVEARALTNDDVQALRQAFLNEGWTPNGERTLRTTDNETDSQFYSVVLEYSTGSDDEQAHIVYSDRDESAGGLHSEYIDVSGNGENDHWEITGYTVENGTVSTETDTLENFRGCSNINWGCVMAIAGSYAGMFGSCAACAGPMTAPLCAVCLSAVAGHLSLHTLCPWCHD